MDGGCWLQQVAAMGKHIGGEGGGAGRGVDGGVDGVVDAVLVPDTESPLDACVKETLRLTAHTLGAIRKVGHYWGTASASLHGVPVPPTLILTLT